MHFKLIVTLLFLQPVFPQQCRQVTVCNETPRDMIKGDKGDTGNAGKAGPEGRKGETGSDGIKGEKGLPGESCALGSFGTNLNNKIAALEILLTPASCRLSSANGRQILRSGQEVVCDNGWTVFQRNFDFDNLNFDLNWNQYKQGFGNLSRDFWFGLDNIHGLTKHQGCRLRVDLWNGNDEHAFAEYSDFHVEDENDNYRLHVAGYNGTTRDSLTYHDSMRFSARNRDNDLAGGANCASVYRSGWWFNNCEQSALNGNRGNPSWRGFISLRKTTMKVRCD